MAEGGGGGDALGCRGDGWWRCTLGKGLVCNERWLG